MKHLVYIIIMFFTFLYAPSFEEDSGPEWIDMIRPRYGGIADGLKPYHKKYMKLAYKRGIHFKNKVTMGFRKITREFIAGTCYYGQYYREIDVSLKYWNEYSNTSRTTLVFHELTHCYCGRNHDYGPNEDQKYPENNQREYSIEPSESSNNKKPGFFKDTCPISIMYPVVISDKCMNKHRSEYIKEMLDRCNEW